LLINIPQLDRKIIFASMKQLLIRTIALIKITTNAQKAESPYEWDWTTDGIWTGTALLGSAGGFLLVQNKDFIDPAEFMRIQNDLQGEIDTIYLNFKRSESY
jgi:hypothetical protein